MDLKDILSLHKDKLVDLLKENNIRADRTQKMCDLQSLAVENLSHLSQRNSNDSGVDEEEFKKILPTLIPLVPEFSEKDVEAFFNLFERTATSFGWKIKFWHCLIQTRIFGKAREIYLSLPPDQCHDYHLIKSRIINAYAKSPEYYRRKFRETKRPNMTFLEFSRQSERNLDAWCRAHRVTNLAEMKRLILYENLLFSIPQELKNDAIDRVHNDIDMLSLSSFLDDNILVSSPSNQSSFYQQHSRPQRHNAGMTPSCSGGEASDGPPQAAHSRRGRPWERHSVSQYGTLPYRQFDRDVGQSQIEQDERKVKFKVSNNDSNGTWYSNKKGNRGRKS